MTEAIHNTLEIYPWIGLLLVVLMAWLEYVFPPVPGDSTMLFACFLAGVGSLSVPATLAACAGGSIGGALTAYAFGARLGRSYFFLKSSWAAAELARLERGFARFGTRLLLVNRFLPGVRGIFLYAAGIGRLPWRSVLIYSTVSNLFWIALIAWAGSRLGSSWEEVEGVFRKYVWAIAIGLTVYFVFQLARARHLRRRAGDNPVSPVS